MKKIISILVFFLLIVGCSSTKLIPKEETVKYYVITQDVIDPCVSNITYFSNGCISYVSLNYGEPDTTILCGNFQIIKRDTNLTLKQFVRKFNNKY